MKGVMGILLTITTIIITVFFLANLQAGPIGGGDSSSILFTSDVYTMDNALDAAKTYMKTGLRYSVYQACYDIMNGMDLVAYGESDFLDELGKRSKTNMNTYRPSYTFLNKFDVKIPHYDYLGLMANPFPESQSYTYDVELRFGDSPIAVPDVEYTPKDIKSIVNNLGGQQRPNDLGGLAIYLAFSSNRHLLSNDSQLQSFRVFTNNGKLNERQSVIADAIVLSALSKFRPGFVEKYVNTINVIDGFKVRVAGNYFYKGIHRTEQFLSDSFFLPESGEIFIDYRKLVSEGQNAVYREIANIIAFKELGSADWIDNSGIKDLASGGPQFIDSGLGTDPMDYYYIGGENYKRSFSGRPETALGAESLDGPRQDFAGVAAAILSGGESLKDMEKLATEDMINGYPQLRKKIVYAYSFLSKEYHLNTQAERTQVLMEHYTSSSSTNFSSMFSTDVMSALNSAGGEHSETQGNEFYSMLFSLAASPDRLEVVNAEDKYRIEINRSSGVWSDIATGCYVVFLEAKARFLQTRNALESAMNLVSSMGLPKEDAGIVERSADEGDVLCDKLYVSKTGKSIEEMESEILSRIENELRGFGVVESEASISPTMENRAELENNIDVTCSYKYLVNVTVSDSVGDEERKFPVFDGEGISMKGIGVDFSLNAESSITGSPVDITIKYLGRDIN